MQPLRKKRKPGFTALAVSILCLALRPSASCQMFTISDSAIRLINAGKPEEAARYLEDSLKVHNNEAAIHRLIGQVYHVLKRYGKAVEAYADAATLDRCDSCYSDLELAGIISAEDKRTNDAVKYLNAALEHKSKTASKRLALVYFQEGESRSVKKDYDAAAENYRKCLLYTQDTLPCQRLMFCYYKTGRYDSLASFIEQVRGKHPDFEGIYIFTVGMDMAKAKKYLADSKYREAAEYFTKVTQEAPANDQGYVGLAYCSEKLNDTGTAITAYTKAITMGTNDPTATMGLAKMYINAGRLQEAEDFLRSGLKRHITWGAAWISLGEVYTKMGKLTEAAICQRMSDFGLAGYLFSGNMILPTSEQLTLLLGDTVNIWVDHTNNHIHISMHQREAERDSIWQALRSDLAMSGADTSAADSTAVPPDYVPVEKQPIPIVQVQPDYPIPARDAGIGGVVWVKLLVAKTGTVTKAVVIKSDAEIFNQPALEAARQWEFIPAMKGGRPTAVWAVIPFRFRVER